MPGSFDFDSKAPLAENAVPIYVCQYDGEGNFFVLPNVVCLQIDWRAGSDPPTARFAYLLDDLAAAQGFPASIDEVWPLGSYGTYVVQPDDRLVVVAYTPNGDRRFLFDGFAQIPQANLTPSSEATSFTAVGVHARCFDVPIFGRSQRDSVDPNAGGVLFLHLPPRFNPTDRAGKIQPNCTPSGYDVNQSDSTTSYPVFLDESIEANPDPRRAWTLSGLARYILATENDETYVDNPDFGKLTGDLNVLTPVNGDSYNPNDSSTYTVDDAPVRDYDPNNKAWPEALAEQFAINGFLFAWTTTEGTDGPKNGLEVIRLDQQWVAAPKVVWLDERNAGLDPSRNQVAELQLARDLNACVNAFAIETLPRRIELSVILAPLFTPASGDETASNRGQFLKSNLANADATTKRKYRWYGADEAGEGHWNGTSWVSGPGSPIDLRLIFPSKDNKRTYLYRHRRGSHELISRDSLNHPFRASLAYSFDYWGDPIIWDGAGAWTPIPGGWKLLPDRLGIEVDVEDPEQWYIGKDKGEIRGISWVANPPSGPPNNGHIFALRLTTVIDDDFVLPAYALNRPSSPTRFTRLRRVDGRDHFRLEKVHTSSPNYTIVKDQGYKLDGNGNVLVRDDTVAATNHAKALRAAHEVPPLAGSITIPFLTNAYRLGDRIKAIAGRDISLRSNLTGSGEAPFYPMVVGISWSFVGDRQSTTLQLSDMRANPPSR